MLAKVRSKAHRDSRLSDELEYQLGCLVGLGQHCSACLLKYLSLG